MSFFKWLGFGTKPNNAGEEATIKKENENSEIDQTPEVHTPAVDQLQSVQEQIKAMAADPSKMTKEGLEEQLKRMTEALHKMPSSTTTTNPQQASQQATQQTSQQINQPASLSSLNQVAQPTVLNPQSGSYDRRQKINEAGGYSFTVCDMIRLKRFLVIGTENGTYYTTAKDLSSENIQCVARLIEKNHGDEVLNVLEDFSVNGRVSKEGPILLSLAICATCPKPEVQKAAYEKVATICNIPTKLFTFLEYCQKKINVDRSTNPPKPQPNRKRPRIKEMEPTENEERSGPSSAKRLKREAKLNEPFKKVNQKPKKSSGWGRMRRKGVASFYTDKGKDADRLLYLLSKYKQRNNWSHKQVLCYAHPKLNDEDGDMKKAKNLVLAFTTRGYETFKKRSKDYRKENGELKAGVSEPIQKIICYVDTLNEIGKLKLENTGDEEKLLGYMKKFCERTVRSEFAHVNFHEDEPPANPKGRRSAFQLVREHIPTGFLKSVEVWKALLKDMPMTAMIRNLGKMSSLGLFGGDNADNENVKIVCEALANVDRLAIARVHPMKILIALRQYQQEQGDKGDLAWQKNEYICNALDKAFYLSFKQPKLGELFKTGKNYMLCLDVSGSMTWQGCYGCEMITPAMASVAMALVTWNIEEHVDIMAFGGHFESLESRLNKNMTINEALTKTRGMNFGATDCSLPMIYAKENRKDVDVFIVYTDSDTWAGRIHPPVALKQYNQAMNKDAKLIVCAMQSNGFTIADPTNPNMLDMCGFDTNVPDIVSSFAKGELSEKCNVCEDCKRIKVEMQR